MDYLSYFEDGMTAEAYLELFRSVVAEGKTTGPQQSEELAQYTQLNLKRSERWLKKGMLLDEVNDFLKNNFQKTKWIIITEAWCGDAAHINPFLQMIAEQSENIDLRFLLRDDHTVLMDQFLTHGGRAIPKLIVLDENGDVLFDWGPRPSVLQKWYREARKKQLPFEEVKVELQKWYNNDKGVQIQKEILALMQTHFE